MRLTIAALGLVLGLAVGPAAAQDLEPKAYSASPIGAAFLVVSVGRSTGAVVGDPTAPVTDIKAKVNVGVLATGYAFGLFDRLALFTAALPYSYGHISGNVGGESREATRSGLADARFKFSVNLRGNPAMLPREFVKAPRRTIVGTSLTFTTPTGQYAGRKLVNIGMNRWSLKPEVGIAVPAGRWDFDAYLGVWVFSGNDDYYPGGQTRTQDAVVTFQGHVSYTFRPRLWLAFDSTWYSGGEVRVEDGEPTAGVNNSRAGLTLSLPMGRSQSLKVAYSSGVSVRTGTDFKTLLVGWQWLWLTKN